MLIQLFMVLAFALSVGMSALRVELRLDAVG